MMQLFYVFCAVRLVFDDTKQEFFEPSSVFGRYVEGLLAESEGTSI